jgi:hypothetical protein
MAFLNCFFLWPIFRFQRLSFDRTAGHERFSIFLERDGIDGVEGDPIIGFQERDEVAGGLFEADADFGLWVFLPKLQ